MSSNGNLKVTHVNKGPTSRIIVAASCYGIGETTSEPLMIDNLVLIRVKAKTVSAINEHVICISLMKHTLAKDDVIEIYVECNNTFQFRRRCNEIWSNWIDVIKQKNCIQVNCGAKCCGNYHSNHVAYLSQTDIAVNVIKITRPSFPMLYGDTDLTDFILNTSEGDVHVHKACLAAHSSVFKTMFTGSWKETNEGLVEINGYSLQTVQQLKDFLYLGTLPDDGLRPLITLAALYSINDLKDACAKKLALTVLPEDLYSLHEHACANNIPELSCAIAELTLDEVVAEAREIKKKGNDNCIKEKNENE